MLKMHKVSKMLLNKPLTRGHFSYKTPFVLYRSTGLIRERLL